MILFSGWICVIVVPLWLGDFLAHAAPVLPVPDAIRDNLDAEQCALGTGHHGRGGVRISVPEGQSALCAQQQAVGGWATTLGVSRSQSMTWDAISIAAGMRAMRQSRKLMQSGCNELMVESMG